MRRQLALLGALMALGLALLLAWPALDRAADLRRDRPADAPEAAAVARGAYLATLGHCAGCHSAPAGPPWAGGRLVETPFGSVAAANLTPDPDTGLGRWTDVAFRRALKEGRSADGRPLLPVCPYPWFGLLDDADADDLFAFLRSQPPRRLDVRPVSLRPPYGWPHALLAWRAMHHRQAQLPPAPPGARADWSRGAWLVGGIAHCGACHGRHDDWGATAGAFDLRGGAMPAQRWYAPSLLDPREGAATAWTEDELVALLRDGRNAHATVAGPMARVVAHSTRHWRDSDLRAAAEFLRRLPPSQATDRTGAAAPPAAVLRRGEQLYADHCADCHGRRGEGVDDDGPALAGNRAVALPTATNVVRVVLGGGFGPSTAAVPRPAGMPPFATLLGDEDVAAVVSFVRWRFGAQASRVDALDVNRLR